jgi:hypothetical protein
MSRFHLLTEEEFIPRNRKFRESRSDEKVKVSEGICHQIRCTAQHHGLDVPDLYMLLLYMKHDTELKAPSVKELEKKFLEAIEEDRRTSGN